MQGLTKLPKSMCTTPLPNRIPEEPFSYIIPTAQHFIFVPTELKRLNVVV